MFLKRKEDKILKTQIRLGEDYLILLVKIKDLPEWEKESDMDTLEDLLGVKMYRNWP